MIKVFNQRIVASIQQVGEGATIVDAVPGLKRGRTQPPYLSAEET
jgi:hypothetical protein